MGGSGQDFLTDNLLAADFILVMISWALSVIVTVFLISWGANQLTICQDLLNKCQKRFYDNEYMLSLPSCKDPKNRARLEAVGHVNCTQLELENQLGPYGCTFKEWWNQAAPNRVYSWFSHSPLALFGILCLTVVVGIWGIIDYWKHKHTEKARWKFLSGFMGDAQVANTIAYRQNHRPAPQFQAQPQLAFHRRPANDDPLASRDVSHIQYRDLDN